MTTPDRLRSFRPTDFIDDVNRADIGELIGQRLKRAGIVFPIDARYLAIGAGQAHPEIALAETLGIRPSNVTLLDKRFSPTARTRFRNTQFPGLILEENLADFFRKPSEERYDLASTFGMEYLFSDPQPLETLINGLSPRMNANGVVVMFPPTGNRSLWEKYGFSPLEENNDRFYYAVFNNPPVAEK